MKKRIFLTGATGVMGTATLNELLSRGDKFDITVLVRDTKRNRKKVERYGDRIRVIWGDLMNYDDVLKGVSGADYVLHIGGMVSPSADYKPKSVLRVNVTAAENVVKAVKAQPNSDKIKVAYIGSVAQTGDRREPLHWARTGDPIFPSMFDYYAISKCRAERIFAESGLKYWVSLRQSGILYPAILKNMDPIMFHVPIRGVLEWATVEDSGRLMANLCEDGLPEEFWCKFYNIGSGEEYRLTNYDFERYLLSCINCPAPEKIFDVKWFATHNFHGQYYLDSDKLEEYLHFRANIPVKDYFAQMAKADSVPMGIKFAAKTKIAKLFPRCVKLAMYAMACSKEHGTQWWIKKSVNGTPEEKQKVAKRIAAYYGSIEAYNAIPDWKNTDLSHNSNEYTLLNHGYDEQKPKELFTIEDMQAAAAFRGGKCLSTEMVQGDWDTPLEWQDANGNTFTATPRLILLGGHWSPYDMPFPYEGEKQAPRPWDWDKVAKKNPFFAQLWAPLHDANEDNTYGPEVFEGWEK